LYLTPCGGERSADTNAAIFQNAIAVIAAAAATDHEVNALGLAGVGTVPEELVEASHCLGQKKRRAAR
jgi:hypothetical protein